MMKEGLKAPAFNLPSDQGAKVQLKDLLGKWVVLYFYPKDDTPGCTQEACDFRDSLSRITRAKAVVLGVSRDSVEKHKKFKTKYKLSFPLLVDEDAKVCQKYGVWKEKSLYGRKYMGIDRSTFLINPKGKIEKIWNKVSVKGHVDEVLEALLAASQSGAKKSS